MPQGRPAEREDVLSRNLIGQSRQYHGRDAGVPQEQQCMLVRGGGTEPENAVGIACHYALEKRRIEFLVLSVEDQVPREELIVDEKADRAYVLHEWIF